MRILITGAAKGIGAATAKLLRGQGHNITALDIAEPADVDHWVEVDLSDVPAVHTACGTLNGPFDVLINNAGIPPRPGNAEMVLRINVFGPRTMTQAMLPKLATGARIVNVASRAGHKWQQNIDEVKALLALDTPDALRGFIAERNIDGTRAYNLSKEAVIAFTQALTKPLLARDIRANSVSPAPVATDILPDFMTAFGDRAAGALEATGRAASIEEVAQVIAFLASPESHWIKGTDILVDGGMSAMINADALGLEQPC